MARETKVVTLNLAEELLERAVAEKGADYVYDKTMGGCFYEHDGAPSCIVGHVLSYIGLTGEQLATLDSPDQFTDENGDRYTGDTGIGDVADVLAHEYGIELTQHAMDFLIYAQITQDSGQRWGDSLKRAKRELAGVND